VLPFENTRVEDYYKAEKEFERARTLDPDFVDPVIGLANLKWTSVVLVPALVQSEEAFREAREVLEEARRLDQAHSEVKNLEGWIARSGWVEC
jgi:hypothetical protein